MSDMHPAEFHDAGQKVIEWIAAYLEKIRELPVLPCVEPGALMNALPSNAPDGGEPLEAILRDFEELIVPASTHWNHPRFHAYFSVSASGPGILAEALTAALNVNGMVWKSSPAATELEQVVLGWLRDWLGLPRDNFGVIYDTASTSTLHALAAAREYKDPESRTRGARPGLVVYTSEQAHSSVEKGAMALGFGQHYVRKIAVDEEFRMRVDALEAAMRQDAEAGLTPCCVAPTVGTTSSTAIDPVRAIAPIARRHDAWLHVDAAYGGSAAVLPEMRWIMAGCERADSLVINPHKWLGVPVDCSVLYTRKPEQLKAAFSLTPEFLVTPEKEHARNLMDYGVSLGRRFRALKLWFVLRAYGVSGVQQHLREHIGLARHLVERIDEHPDFERLAPAPFSVVVFRHVPAQLRGDEVALARHNLEVLERINRSGVVFMSHTSAKGRIGLRIAIGNWRTTAVQIDQAWGLILMSARLQTQ